MSEPHAAQGSGKRPVLSFWQNYCKCNFMNTKELGHLRKSLFVGLTVICLLGGLRGSIAAPATTNDVTAAAILKDKDLNRYGRVQIATLLAFVSLEDDRPWYVDDALLVLQLPRGQWVLVHAVRNPKYPPGYKNGSTEWGLHHVMDAPHVGDRRFDHRPTRQEVDQFLKDNDWPFAGTLGRRIVKRMVDEDAWERVLGYKPDWPDTP